MSLRPLALAALALLALPATAQPAFRLASPVVVVDGVRAEQAGLVLEQPAFRFLTIAAPGYGRFVVSDRPFTGARRAGEFDGSVLALTIDGRSMRLRGAEPILATRAVVPAYARFDADPAGRPATAATVRFAVAGAAPTTEAVAGAREIRASGRGLSTDPAVRTAATDNRVSARLSAEIERLDAEVARLQAEVARLQGELARRENLRPAADAAVRNADAARAETAALRAERDRLREDLAVRDTETRRLHARVAELEARLAAAPPSTDTEALRAELALARGTRSVSSAEADSLRAELSRVGTENARAADRAAADVAALRAEVDRLDGELRRVTAERDALRSTVGASTNTGSTSTGTTTTGSTTTGSSMAEAGGPGVTTRTTTRGPLDQPFTEGRLAISLPNFDHSRLRNVEEVRGVMANALLPVAALEGHGSGDVLVMFVTDTAGDVVRTEVTESVTPATDAVAEQIVRAMKVFPPTVEGQNAVLRSQVRVRFSR